MLFFRWMMEKARDHQRELFMCFIDCKRHSTVYIIKDYDTLSKTRENPKHLIVVLTNLYINQESTVRIEYGETSNIPIGKVVRQGCIIYPLLFNIYVAIIMRDILEKWDKGIRIGGRKVTNLRYADDTTLIAGTKDDLTELITKVKRAREEAGLYLNVMKTKVMTTGKLDHIIVYDNNIEIVDKYILLGVIITNDGVTDKELRRRLAMGKYAMVSLKRIFKDRGIRLTTKIMIVQTLVFLIILYGAETWTIKKADRKTIDAFELWCWRKLLGVTYLDMKRNTEINDIIQTKRTLESRIVKSDLSFFGHIVRSDIMELKIMLGRMEGRRGRGRPH